MRWENIIIFFNYKRGNFIFEFSFFKYNISDKVKLIINRLVLRDVLFSPRLECGFVAKIIVVTTIF